MGLLKVELLDGAEIHGADRSGKSDVSVIPGWRTANSVDLLTSPPSFSRTPCSP
jgi:hypothetical protein